MQYSLCYSCVCAGTRYVADGRVCVFMCVRVQRSLAKNVKTNIAPNSVRAMPKHHEHKKLTREWPKEKTECAATPSIDCAVPTTHHTQTVIKLSSGVELRVHHI